LLRIALYIFDAARSMVTSVVFLKMYSFWNSREIRATNNLTHFILTDVKEYKDLFLLLNGYNRKVGDFC